MCGRFVVKSTTEVIRDMFGDYEVIEQYAPNFNVAPGQTAPLLLHSKGQKQIRNLHWGLIPFFAKDSKVAYKMINARSETIHQKPSFRKPFQKRRCAVIADGFYEWRKLGKTKVPYFIGMATAPIMLMAGIYDHWKGPENTHRSTFSIITVPANNIMAKIHNDKERMPAIFTSGCQVEQWLDQKEENPQTLLELLKPLPEDALKAHIVHKDVSNSRNNREDLTDAVDEVYVKETYGEVPALAN